MTRSQRAGRQGDPMKKTLQTFLTAAGGWTARPAAFALVAIYTVIWIIYDRASLDFHGVIALITLCMTLLIQRAEHRDTQAIQAKLDELLRTQAGADKDLTRLDEREPEQIEDYRAKPKPPT